jgi:beta-xylosidase
MLLWHSPMGSPRSALRILRILGLPLALVLLLSGSAIPGSARLSYHNPVFARDFPDPMVLRAGPHSYYAYATATGWEAGYFPILHSADLIHWRYVGDIFPLTRPPSDAGDTWAPDVIMYHGTYYAFFTAGSHCIDVATARSPTGPFHERGRIDCDDSVGAGLIDPAPLVAPNGTVYLYAAVDSPHHLTVIPLKPNLLHEQRRGLPLFGVTQRWEGNQTVEGPFPLYFHGRYYLFYSGNSWEGPDYAVGYAVSSSPTGPFRKCSCNPILHRQRGVTGPGGESIVRGPDGKLWIVYHAWTHGAGYQFGGVRSLWVDHLTWTGHQFIVHPTP